MAITKKANEANFKRYFPTYESGLTSEQVNTRITEGANNKAPKSLTRSIPRIISDNTFTLFNFLNIALAVVILSVAEAKNVLFLGVALSNTLLGIFQEVRAKITLDRLSIVTKSKVEVIRDNTKVYISMEQIVLDDIIALKSGDQICVDGTILKSDHLEVDESLLTGESDTIKKKEDNKVLSGSFVTAGSGFMRVDAVGNQSYAAKLSLEAKKEKKPKSELIRTLNKIIKTLTLVIIPLGSALFSLKYFVNEGGLKESILGVSAAVLGMIPEGLMLLTGVAFAVGSVNLVRHRTLVQSMPSIETLSRVDVLCLDKTGTITDGTLKLIETLPVNGFSKDLLSISISEVLRALPSDNSTSKAIREVHNKDSSWNLITAVPFSSKRKWSGATFSKKGSYILGAPEFILKDTSDIQGKIEEASKKGYRVLCVAHSDIYLIDENLPRNLSCVGLLILSDNVRENAPKTFDFFARQGVTIKIISGDNPLTVSNVSKQAGVKNSHLYVDMSKFGEDEDFSELVEKNVVFGRVSPHQKKNLIKALQNNGHVACMTGDGVNDVLSLKEAQCSVAMAGGSEAAKAVSDFVLLDSDFSAMVQVLNEGRRVVNNIEKVASLYLVKTIYSIILSIFYMFLPHPYPFTPLQLSPINMLTVGIPSFFLTLRPNYNKLRGKFIQNILFNAAPASLTIVLNIFIIQILGSLLDLPLKETSTMCILLIGTVGFLLLTKLAKPFTKAKQVSVCFLAIIFLCIMLFMRDFFTYHTLISINAFIYIPLILLSNTVFCAFRLRIIRIARIRGYKKRRKANK